MIESLKEYFESKGFTGLKVNTDGIFVYTMNQNDTTHVIILFHMPAGNELNREQYEHIEEQIMTACKARTEYKISLLTVFISYHMEMLQPLYRNNDHVAVCDLSNGKFVLFEGQTIDSLGIYKELDELVFAATQRMRNQQSMNSQSMNQQGMNQQDGYEQEVRYAGGRLAVLRKKFGLITCVLVAVNVVIFLVLSFSGLQERAVEAFCLNWRRVSENHEYYRIITSMFLHADIEHVGSNMLILAVIGSKVEKLLGKARYTIAYLLTGIIAGIVSMSYNMINLRNSSSIGASGAVFGIIGVLLGIIIKKKGNVEELSKRQMLLFIALSLYGGFSNQGIDNMAHVGGLIAGTLVGLMIYKKTNKGSVIS